MRQYRLPKYRFWLQWLIRLRNKNADLTPIESWTIVKHIHDEAKLQRPHESKDCISVA